MYTLIISTTFPSGSFAIVTEQRFLEERHLTVTLVQLPLTNAST